MLLLLRSSSLLSVVAAVFAALLLSVASAVNIRGSIVSGKLVEDTTALSPSTRVVLNSGERVAHIARDGSFVLRGVTKGTHILEVLSPEYIFQRYVVAIDTDSDPKGGARVNIQYYQPGAVYSLNGGSSSSSSSSGSSSLGHPLAISPVGKTDFFTPRPSLNITSIFANPYMLLMGVSVLMLFVLPKLQEQIDPKGRAEWEEEKARLLKSMPSTNTGDMAEKLAGWMSSDAGASKESSTAVETSAAAQEGVKERKKKKKEKKDTAAA
ncbi:hypothetical protein GQ42DRAFT_162246 [Ramicandelaber brevisporus]|nr:hypothetical protein GQ42DRAFT_162246 [Ramicandelaber brevisporus]